MTAVPSSAAWRRRGPARAALGVVLAAGLASAPAAAQAPPSPAPPPPPQGAPAQVPVLRPPSGPPPAAAPRTSAGTGGVVQPSATPLQPPPGRARSAPPDSSRLPPAADEATPANAVARCRDGTFVIAPADASACSAHRGVGVVFPRRTAPPAPAARPVPTARVAAPSEAPPPTGATMRCKDGTWLTGTPAPERCSANGGTAVILPAARPTPLQPLPHRP